MKVTFYIPQSLVDLLDELGVPLTSATIQALLARYIDSQPAKVRDGAFQRAAERQMRRDRAKLDAKVTALA